LVSKGVEMDALGGEGFGGGVVGGGEGDEGVAFGARGVSTLGELSSDDPGLGVVGVRATGVRRLWVFIAVCTIEDDRMPDG
jgi:hypothetical protein